MNISDTELVFQTTASDCTFVSLLAARAEIIRKVKATSGFEDAEINARLICYCSDQVISSSLLFAGFFSSYLLSFSLV